VARGEIQEAEAKFVGFVGLVEFGVKGRVVRGPESEIGDVVRDRDGEPDATHL
jgi:hypothetical protein